MENLNRIKELCQKAKSLNLDTWGVTVPDATLMKVEKALDIILPSDFIAVLKCFPYYGMTAVGQFFEFYEVLENHGYKSQNGVIDYDLVRIRAVDWNLDRRKEYKNFEKILVLADDRDVDAILMFTQDDRQKPTPIVWCDYEDLYNYSETGQFKYKIDKWDSFTDFFEFLIEKEEEAIKEEKELVDSRSKQIALKKSFWQRLFRK